MERQALSDFVFIYEKFATAENKSLRTIEAVGGAVDKFDNFLGGGANPKEIQAEDLRRYIRYLQSKSKWSEHPTIKGEYGNLSPHAIASYVRSIRAFWSWLKHEGFIEENTLEVVRLPKAPRKIVDTLTPKQIAQLLSVIPRNSSPGYRDYTITIALYGLGVRVSELTGLKLPEVDFDNGQIRVMGKGKRQRFLYMSERVYKCLFKYVNQWRPKVQSAFFFIHKNGRPLTRFYVAHRMKFYGQRAGIDGVRCSPHTFRHTFAVEFIRAGGDVFVLQKILGHSSLDMTRHYTELADSDVKTKMKAYSPVERLEFAV